MLGYKSVASNDDINVPDLCDLFASGNNDDIYKKIGEITRRKPELVSIILLDIIDRQFWEYVGTITGLYKSDIVDLHRLSHILLANESHRRFVEKMWPESYRIVSSLGNKHSRRVENGTISGSHDLFVSYTYSNTD